MMDFNRLELITQLRLPFAPDHTQRFAAPESATAHDYERITTLLLDVLDRTSYLNPSTRESSELKIRRLVRRLGLPASDTDTWLGILRQILWKTSKGE